MNEATWFNGNDDLYSLKARTTSTLSLELIKWDTDEYTWLQSSANEQGKVNYRIHVSKVNSDYTIYIGNKSAKYKSDKSGVFEFEIKSGNTMITLK